MPRGQKSKLRAREKRRQAHTETQGLEVAKATGAAAVGQPSSSVFGDRPENLPAAGTPSTPEAPEGATGATAASSSANSAENINSPKAESTSFPKGAESSLSEILSKKVVLLVQFLLQKYQKKEPIRKAEMMKFVIKQYKSHYNEILKRASDHMELAFGVDLKEVDPTRHCYTLVNKLDLSYDSALNEYEHMPKTGILMIVLGVIFMRGNCAPEEAIWEVLNMMGVYAERKHFIYGDPKKVLTEDLVQLKYLEYRQVANSEPPRYEFLWGPRAHAETSKMKVLEFLAKVHDTVPTAFPSWYQEALRDEEERARARAAARARMAALASACSRARARASTSSQAK